MTTIPSSTTKPVARTIAKSVRILILKPQIYITKNVAINEIGISINGLIAIKIFLKKKKITNTTRLKEINNVSITSLILLRTFFVLSIKVVN